MAVWNSISYIYKRALHSFLSFAHCRLASTVIPLLPKAIGIALNSENINIDNSVILA